MTRRDEQTHKTHKQTHNKHTTNTTDTQQTHNKRTTNTQSKYWQAAQQTRQTDNQRPTHLAHCLRLSVRNGNPNVIMAASAPQDSKIGILLGVAPDPGGFFRNRLDMRITREH
jgi:hypothetical protein